MRQDSEINIIVLNTALKYKIQRYTKTQIYYIQTHTKKHKHILHTITNTYEKEPVQKPERSVAPRERLKAFTEEKLIISHGKLFQNVNHTL